MLGVLVELSQALGLALLAAILLAGGRLGHRWPVAIAGYVVLALQPSSS